MAKITIKNANDPKAFDLKKWNTGLNAANGGTALDTDENREIFPVVAGNGAIKFRFWETNQYMTVEAGKTETLTVTDLSAAEKAYYEGLNGVGADTDGIGGLEVSVTEA